MYNLHASAVAYKNHGVLIFGKSGTGKSDLCLRLITEYGAFLVADDRTNVTSGKGILIASAPANLQGMLEVRGVGILKPPYMVSAQIDLAVELFEGEDKPHRLPDSEEFEHDGIKVPLIRLRGLEASASAKIVAALTFPKISL